MTAFPSHRQKGAVLLVALVMLLAAVSYTHLLSIGLALILMISSNLDEQLLDVVHIDLFRTGSWVYLILNIFIAVLVQKPKHLMQLFSLALVDVIFLSALFYAAGGTPSGIGNLLVLSLIHI